VAEPRINDAKARMLLAPAFRKPLFLNEYESKGELLLLTMQL
jgi:hypothetical protein